MYDISGTVVNATPDCSQESFAKLEHAASESQEEFGQILTKMLENRPAPNVVVALQGISVTRETVTDSQGRFNFVGLPKGVYSVSAEVSLQSSGTGVKQMARAKKQVNPGTDWSTVWLELHADFVAVRGRITDVHGRPVGDAKVTGIPVPIPGVEEITPDSVSTVSNADGSYELQGLAPPSLYPATVGYLMGGNPAAGRQCFYVDVRVQANGFVQGQKRVPIVPEQLLDPARRLLKIMTKLDGGSKLREKKDLPLPSSRGNAITDVNIVLDQAGNEAQ